MNSTITSHAFSKRALSALLMPACAIVQSALLMACLASPLDTSEAGEAQPAEETEIGSVESSLLSIAWERIDGCGGELAVGGPNLDDVWVLGCTESNLGREIFHRVNNTWVKVPGFAQHIAVDANGQPWVVNKQKIFYRAHDVWWPVEGCASDIAVGLPSPGTATVSTGPVEVTPWIIGCVGGALKDIAFLSRSPGWSTPALWTTVNGALTGLRMSAHDTLPHGFGQHNFGQYKVYQARSRNGSSVDWALLPGCVWDLAIGHASVGAIGCDFEGPSDEGQIYFRTRADVNGFEKLAGGAKKIAIGSRHIWLVGSKGEIFRGDPSTIAKVPLCGALGRPVCDEGAGPFCFGAALAPLNGICEARRAPQENEGCGGLKESCCTHPIYSQECIGGRQCRSSDGWFGSNVCLDSEGSGGGTTCATGERYCGACPSPTDYVQKRTRDTGNECSSAGDGWVFTCVPPCATDPALSVCGESCPAGYRVSSRTNDPVQCDNSPGAATTKLLCVK